VTLIVTSIGKFGLLQAADSNVTNFDNNTVREAPKVFELGFSSAALAIAGSYRIGARSMEEWVPSCVADYLDEDSDASLESFAHYLARRLTEGMTPGQRALPTLVHIVGFTGDGARKHPEMWFVRNPETINPGNGHYENMRDEFFVSEDYWSRDYPRNRAAIDAGMEWNYFNGTPDGLGSFIRFGPMFQSFLQQVWAQPGWHFRPPTNLREEAALVELKIRVVGTLFQSSDYSAPSVGGPPQIWMAERN
jgi:hypothetical protein